MIIFAMVMLIVFAITLAPVVLVLGLFTIVIAVLHGLMILVLNIWVWLLIGLILIIGTIASTTTPLT
jgi:hypothetical protein